MELIFKHSEKSKSKLKDFIRLISHYRVEFNTECGLKQMWFLRCSKAENQSVDIGVV